MDVRKKLVELFYDNNVRCDQKIEGLADDVMDIVSHGVTVEMKTIHKPDKPISTEIIDFIDWFSVEAPSEYEKGVVAGLRIAETIAEVIERNCEESSV